MFLLENLLRTRNFMYIFKIDIYVSLHQLNTSSNVKISVTYLKQNYNHNKEA